jgi:hypothetical protein
MQRVPGERILGSEAELIQDQRWLTFKLQAAAMVLAARKLSVAGESWRNFKVATVAQAYDFEGQPYFLDGANTTVQPGDPKSCGEMKVMRDAQPKYSPDDEDDSNGDDEENRQGMKIYAMVVSGPPQKDQTSGLESATLHCCGACREIMAGEIMEGGVVSKETIILTVDPRRATCEIQTLGELLENHRDAIHGKDPMLNPYRSPYEYQIDEVITQALNDFASTHQDIVYAQPPDYGALI